MSRQWSTSTHRLVWLNWPKEHQEWEKGFANASDYLETWDDSDNITTVNAQKIGDMLEKWWHSHLEAQYQGFEIKNYHTEVDGTELRIKSNNLISLRISNT